MLGALLGCVWKRDRFFLWIPAFLQLWALNTQRAWLVNRLSSILKPWKDCTLLIVVFFQNWLIFQLSDVLLRFSLQWQQCQQSALRRGKWQTRFRISRASSQRSQKFEQTRSQSNSEISCYLRRSQFGARSMYIHQGLFLHLRGLLSFE